MFLRWCLLSVQQQMESEIRATQDDTHAARDVELTAQVRSRHVIVHIVARHCKSAFMHAYCVQLTFPLRPARAHPLHLTTDP